MTLEKFDEKSSTKSEINILRRAFTNFKYRHTQCVLIFLSFVIFFIIKGIMSVAIIFMTNNTSNPDFEMYNWSESEKSYVLSSSLWGYTIVIIPGSLLLREKSPKIAVVSLISIFSLSTILTPTCAQYGGWQLICLFQAISGACEGVSFSSIYSIFVNWIPPKEREYLVPICYLGPEIGIVTVLAVGGTISSSAIGWPGMFYIFGSFGLIVVIFWWFFGFDRPADCNFISQKEREYIEESLTNLDDNGMKINPTPLRKVIFSMAFFGTLLAQGSTTFGSKIFFTELPTFIAGTFISNIESSVLVSALPYVGMLLLTVVFIVVNTIITKRRSFSLLVQRKMYNTISEWIPACLLIALAYIPRDNLNLAISIITIAVSCTAAQAFGCQINYMDLSPTHAGILFGFSSTFANLLGLVAPLIVGVVVTNPSNFEQWMIVFWITAGFFFIGNLLFLVFAKVNNI